jgi:hypothetical protein
MVFIKNKEVPSLLVCENDLLLVHRMVHNNRNTVYHELLVDHDHVDHIKIENVEYLYSLV